MEGDFNNVPAIFASAKDIAGPIWGVFALTMPAFRGDSSELQQGKDLVDAALANGVSHFVYASVDRGGEKSLENRTIVPHFASKHDIDLYLIEKAKGSDMTWTILRPAAFMDNVRPDFFGKVFATAWKYVLKDKPLQLVVVMDIGYFAAQCLDRPGNYRNRAIGLAGEELTYEQALKVFREKLAMDMPLTYWVVLKLFMYFVGDVGKMFRWFVSDGYTIDIPKLREEYPGMTSFAEYLESESRFKKRT